MMTSDNPSFTSTRNKVEINRAIKDANELSERLKAEARSSKTTSSEEYAKLNRGIEKNTQPRK